MCPMKRRGRPRSSTGRRGWGGVLQIVAGRKVESRSISAANTDIEIRLPTSEPRLPSGLVAHLAKDHVQDAAVSEILQLGGRVDSAIGHEFGLLSTIGIGSGDRDGVHGG